MQKADPSQYKFDENNNVIQIEEQRHNMVDQVMEDNVTMNQEGSDDGDAGKSSGGSDTDDNNPYNQIQVQKSVNVIKQ